MKNSKHADKECFAIIRVKVAAFGDGFIEIESDDKRGKKIVRLPSDGLRELEFINAAK